MLKKYFAFVLCATLIPLSTAQARAKDPNWEGCSNDECYTEAENLGAALGLMAATFLPYWFIPNNSRNFLTGKKKQIFIVGGFIEESLLASAGTETNEIRESNFGLNTNLSLASLSDGFPTNLQYELTPTFAFFKNDDLQVSFGSGIAVEKFMENSEFSAGPPTKLTLHYRFSGVWGLKSDAGVYWLRRPVYRANLQGVWFSQKSDSAATFGYRYEDHRYQRAITHFIFAGFLF